MKIIGLRCEYLQNPLGIDVAQPHLSWRLESDDPEQRGLKQTAYQIQVGTEPETSDLWDSGKINSDQTTQIEYIGQKLASGQQCFWRVQVWNGNTSTWSETAHWSMGLLKASDWQAKWIGY